MKKSSLSMKTSSADVDDPPRVAAASAAAHVENAST
jgi:hypothetical protein